MTFLENITSPADVRQLSTAECQVLTKEIRDCLITTVAQTGGHLGPNLGVVELTTAIHRVFESPRDTILFDVGHQSYVHKLLTGRYPEFSTLRQRGGISGYPSRAESEHDVIENSHASSSLSWADGIAKARQLTGEQDRHVVTVIGDGALTGGMAWEALNTIAADKSQPPRKLIIVVNDNGRSYAPTVGGFAEHLDSLRTSSQYEKFLSWGKERLQQSGPPGRAAYSAMHGMKKGLKDMMAPAETGMFDELGIKYVGPVDGHDLDSLERALAKAKDYDQGPVIVHALTQKGYGYAPAMADMDDQFHAVGVIDAETGRSQPSKSTSWTSVFGDEITRIARERKDIVAITAAMLIPVGLKRFAEEFPERVFDVGIAEQHAVASAAGLSYGGLHPVVCLYATFLNRAFDQLLMDVALHKQGVTFVLDRAGITGPDGASHHGIWDIAMLQVVPGLQLAAPRDATRLVEEFNEAVAIEDAPTVVRFSRGSVGNDIEALSRTEDGVDILAEPADGLDRDVLIVSVGALADRALALAEELRQRAIGATVIDPRWVLPVPDSVLTMGKDHALVAVVEDGVKIGGIGSQIRQDLRDEDSRTGVVELGVPDEFLPHGTREEILEYAGLSVPDMLDNTLHMLPPHLAERAHRASRRAM
ncbi:MULTISPECIES: 1-deoxy-D-xylulose-5-phosphate synthase [Brevibacterium]|uniref:1-deoxy-D-xylulose-5-phosphate synthase n=1 Tax=Brevibacterium TaxID=1696 RepID=UPI0021AF3BF4|nr:MULTISPECIES: 1-deoxy-D-xylulose-5-phosphate synthase [Brevibacterium]MCT1829000.1 1-deoxy-D-xylulose-5-phosphate synthase [Brevibacterium luteolum]MCT1873038.1 1-deoxy-D-xylulose-5-phosphate synthase [Brevibacterium luteolum]MCT1890472.1 1-deoxy-D-xylulose-5-phosphate synthase [Brevibacterium luteolum]MCT1891979.1 1-deoxy-D-xylulose-5-phosphate synthase [Brevibacterium luteolum]MCT1923742.1 1-deoxy-D-xylulose-5-phosphate synthase [Brevibacterium luteolum]